jgi:hypothetical protein
MPETSTMEDIYLPWYDGKKLEATVVILMPSFI